MADFTIASQVSVPKVDPLALLSSVQGVQGQALQNKLLGQKLSGTTDVAKAVSGATDPDTGKVDWVKASSLLPAGSYGAPDLAERAISNQQGQQVLTTAKIQQHVAEQGYTQAQIQTSAMENANAVQIGQSILGSKDTSAQNVTAMLDQAAPNLFKSPEAQQQLAAFKAQLGPDPAANAALLKKFVQVHGTVADALGKMSTVQTGGATGFVRTDPISGAPQVTGAIDNTLSPGEAVSPNRTYVDANGVTHTVLKGEEHLGGADNPTGHIAAPAAGTIEAQAGQRAASGQQYTADVNDAGGFAQRMQGLTNAEKALRGAQSGKGGQALQDWRAVLNTLGVPLSAEDKAKAVNFDEAKKYLTDYANRRGAALGMGTDAGREMIHAANPSVDINKPAALDILKVIKGLERMQNAQQAIAAQQGIQPGDYSTWRAGWNRSVDPAGFMADQIPAAQRAKTFDALKPAQQTKYVNAVKAAIAAGYFTAEDLRK